MITFSFLILLSSCYGSFFFIGHIDYPMILASNAIRTCSTQEISSLHSFAYTNQLTKSPYRIWRKYTARRESKSTSGSISVPEKQVRIQPSSNI